MNSPTKVTFVIHVYRDQHLARRLVDQIISHYDNEHPILVIGDGEEPVGFPPFAMDFFLPRRKHHFNGEWTQRFLMLARATNSDVIIKLDPDTCLWRKFSLPDAEWFGTLSTNGTWVRGGACGFRRDAADRMIESGLLLSTVASYCRYGLYRWPWELEDRTPISNQDRIVGQVMAQLGIPATDWPDAGVLGNEGRVAEKLDFSLTHPHPLALPEDPVYISPVAPA